MIEILNGRLSRSSTPAPARRVPPGLPAAGASGPGSARHLERAAAAIERPVAVAIDPACAGEELLRLGEVVTDRRHLRVVRPDVGRERPRHRARGAVIE